MQRIPLVDLAAQHRSMRRDLRAAVAGVFGRSEFIGGAQVEGFERAFARFCGARHAVGVASGTDALALALRACGVRPGDEVITSPLTFIATAEAIGMAGARPLFADVSPDCLTLDPDAVEAAVTPRARAVVAVHLYGQTADMGPLARIASRHGLALLEDACQAHGASYQGRRAGTLAAAAAFSFYPGKNLGACGDAGAVVTDDEEVAARVRLRRNHGRTGKYDHIEEGVNSRLDGLQAAILLAKIGRLEAWNEARSERASWYDEGLEGQEGIRLPRRMPGRRHVHHLYVIRSMRRDALRAALMAEGIEAGVHYPTPLHLLGAYRHLGHPAGAFPEAEAASRQVLSLPLFPEMTRGQVERVCEAVRRFVARAAA